MTDDEIKQKLERIDAKVERLIRELLEGSPVDGSRYYRDPDGRINKRPGLWLGNSPGQEMNGLMAVTILALFLVIIYMRFC